MYPLRNSRIVRYNSGIGGQSRNSYFAQENSGIVPIPTLHRTKTVDSQFVPIPTLRRDNSGIEPCQVGSPTSPDKMRIPTLSGTILEFSRFLLCAEHIHALKPCKNWVFCCHVISQNGNVLRKLMIKLVRE